MSSRVIYAHRVSKVCVGCDRQPALLGTLGPPALQSNAHMCMPMSYVRYIQTKRSPRLLHYVRRRRRRHSVITSVECILWVAGKDKNGNPCPCRGAKLSTSRSTRLWRASALSTCTRARTTQKTARSARRRCRQSRCARGARQVLVFKPNRNPDNEPDDGAMS